MKQSVNLGQELGRCFRDLHMASNEFNKKVPARQSLKFEEIYPSLTKTMLAWCNNFFKFFVILINLGEDVQKQAVVFHKNLLCFFKYTSLEDDVFREVDSINLFPYNLR